MGSEKKNRRSKEVKKPRDRLRHSRDDEKLFDFSNRIGQESSDTTQITRCEKQPSLLSAAAAAAALSPPSAPSPPSSPSTFFHLFAQGLKSFGHIPANGNSSLQRWVMNELLMFWNCRLNNKDVALQLQAVPQLEQGLLDEVVQHPYCGLTAC